MIQRGRDLTISSDDWAVVGTRIRRLRQERGLSQDEVARPDLSASYLSRIESGTRRPTDRVLAELAQRFDTTVEHLVSGEDPRATESAELDLSYAELELRNGDPHDAHQRFAATLERLAPSGSKLITRARIGLAQASEAAGNLEGAVQLFETVTEEAVVGSKTWFDAALGSIRCYRQVGDIGRSVDCGEKALRVCRDAAVWPTPDAVRIMATLQASYQVRGDYFSATRLASEAVDIAETLADRRALASALWNTSLLNSELGAKSDAVAMAERALTLLSEVDAERDLARLRIALARLHTLDGRPDTAIEVLDALAPRLADLNVTAETTYAQTERARALLASGNPQAAETAAEQALAALGDSPRSDAAEIHVMIAAAARAQGHGKVAASHLRRAAELLTAIGVSREAGLAWVELAAHLDALGDVAGARDAYRAATASLGAPTPTGTFTLTMTASP